MISKQLIHKVITFLNTFNSNKNVIWDITVWNARPRITCNINVWSLDNNNTIKYCVGSINDTIHNIEEFNKFKETVEQTLPSILEKL